MTTKECDASEAYKESLHQGLQGGYRHHPESGWNAGKGDLKPLLKSDKGRDTPSHQVLLPVPGKMRYPHHPLLHHPGPCKCGHSDVDNALLFCGSNAYRAERMETVDEVMDALMGI